MRQFLVFVHRYIGLMLVPFLVIVGFTGSILAFYNELDRGLNPELLTVPVPETVDELSVLDLFTFRDRIEAQWPHVHVDLLKLHHAPDEAYRFFLVPRIDPETGEGFELTDNEVFFNPYTGEQIGARDRRAVSLAKENIMPFLHRLHWSLALPEHLLMFGVYALGAAALLWFFDCFIGFYLTLPSQKKQTPQLPHFWQRWKSAWQIKPSRFNYDLHRAGGLWLWPLFLVLAWSGVAFNLNVVYQPVMGTLFDKHDKRLPALEQPIETPDLDMRAAYQRGQLVINAAAKRNGFAVEHETYLRLDRMRGVYFYHVKTDREMGGVYGETVAVLNADTGALVSLNLPDTDSIGNIVHRWIIWLHTARVFGLPMQILICMTGLAIVSLSITGAVIWLRKRNAHKPRSAPKMRPTEKIATE